MPIRMTDTRPPRMTSQPNRPLGAGRAETLAFPHEVAASIAAWHGVWHHPDAFGVDASKRLSGASVGRAM